MTATGSIVRPGVDYTITDPSDALYDADSRHPAVDARFEWLIRLNDDETKAMYRRQREERRELRARHSRELRADVARQRTT